jgi:hypothetical protein
MLTPTLEQRISANGNADEGSTADFSIVHHTEDIGGVLLHRGWTFTNAGIPMSAEIRENQVVSRGERIRNWQPEFVIRRKRVEENH